MKKLLENMHAGGKKDYCIYETLFYINLIVTTETIKKCRTETHNIKKEETEKKNPRIPPNWYNRQKQEGKETMETPNY